MVKKTSFNQRGSADLLELNIESDRDLKTSGKGDHPDGVIATLRTEQYLTTNQPAGTFLPRTDLYLSASRLLSLSSSELKESSNVSPASTFYLVLGDQGNGDDNGDDDDEDEIEEDEESDEDEDDEDAEEGSGGGDEEGLLGDEDEGDDHNGAGEDDEEEQDTDSDQDEPDKEEDELEEDEEEYDDDEYSLEDDEDDDDDEDDEDAV